MEFITRGIYNLALKYCLVQGKLETYVWKKIPLSAF